MAQTGTSSPRFYDLDALRATTMFLGIVLHSSVFLIPEPHPIWPIHDSTVDGDPTYKVVIEILHGFRMPVFFTLSGFFSALLWQRRSLRAMTIQRLQRVGLPFVIGCLTIVPLSVWLLAVASDFQEPYNFPLWALPIMWVYSIAHLWFLWHLLILAGCFILAVRMGLRFQHPVAWWLVVPLSMVCSLLMVEPIYGADVSTVLAADPAVLAFYACFFLFGVFFYQREFTIRRWWTVALLPAAIAFYAGLSLLEQYLATYEGSVPDNFMFKNPLTLASALIETICIWLMCFGLMGLFRWIASRKSFYVRYFSDASYWMYLMHVPLVIAGQMLVVDWPIHYHLKFFLVCGGVTLILVVTYQLGVRYTVIGKMLNGPRTRRTVAVN